MFQQLLINGIIAGSAYALVAVSFSLIYSTTRFFHFAHGAVYAAGPYFVYLLIELLGLNPVAALPLAVLMAASLGVLFEFVAYRPLRKSGASALIFLLASLGLLIVSQNLISLAFGDQAKSLRRSQVIEGIRVFGARITPIQIVIIVCSLLVSLMVWAWLRYSRMGRVVRAVGNERELARIVGIDSSRTMLVTFLVGSGVVGIAGILASYDTDMRPTMGFEALLVGVVAVIIGGVGSVEGSFLGAFLIGLAQNVGVWRIGTQWQDAITFVLLLLFLLLRPQGLLGKSPRSATV